MISIQSRQYSRGLVQCSTPDLLDYVLTVPGQDVPPRSPHVVLDLKSKRAVVVPYRSFLICHHSIAPAPFNCAAQSYLPAPVRPRVPSFNVQLLGRSFRVQCSYASRLPVVHQFAPSSISTLHRSFLTLQSLDRAFLMFFRPRLPALTVPPSLVPHFPLARPCLP